VLTGPRPAISGRSQGHCRIGIPQRPHRRCSRRKTVPQLCGQGRILPYNARGDEKHHEAAVDTVYKLLWLKQNDLEKYEATIEFGNRHTRFWDEPKADVG